MSQRKQSVFLHPPLTLASSSFLIQEPQAQIKESSPETLTLPQWSLEDPASSCSPHSEAPRAPARWCLFATLVGGALVRKILTCRDLGSLATPGLEKAWLGALWKTHA